MADNRRQPAALFVDTKILNLSQRIIIPVHVPGDAICADKCQPFKIPGVIDGHKYSTAGLFCGNKIFFMRR